MKLLNRSYGKRQALAGQIKNTGAYAGRTNINSDEYLVAHDCPDEKLSRVSNIANAVHIFKCRRNNKAPIGWRLCWGLKHWISLF